jgi:hypothetical protein
MNVDKAAGQAANKASATTTEVAANKMNVDKAAGQAANKASTTKAS